ncbi:hypothetical protein GCM10008922_48720 [Faecalicatena contorta]
MGCIFRGAQTFLVLFSGGGLKKDVGVGKDNVSGVLILKNIGVQK